MPATIIVVDDHPVFRQGLCHLLAKEKDLSVVGEAGDGRTAIDLVHRENPDIVVMDVSMPDVDGIEATRQILSESPGTKIVALSIHSGKQFVAGMIGAGALGYILKESVPEEMIQGIRTVLAGEVYLSASISGIVISEYKKLLSEAAPATEISTEVILNTKIQRPPLSSNIIARPRLIEQLKKSLQGWLTLVSAPAGYGKSIAVSQWLEACGYPAAWVSLDETDNDLGLFLNYVLAAIQTVFPDAGRKTMDGVNSLTLPKVSVLARNLINELNQIKQHFILVLDDFHIIKDETILDLVAGLLRHPPQVLHLVLIGRRDPALSISTLRARSLVTEIRTQDLRFRKTEIEEFLTKLEGTQIDSSTAAVLEEKTEGWVTGLSLAAMSMIHRGGLDPKLLEPQVDAQYVMEYLFNEVYSHQPPEVSRYFLGTAILDRFCGPLCEAVCAPGAEPFTCEISGWEFVALLKKENLFLISLDAENRWFRFHHLFQKLLVNQLNRRCSAEEIKALHAQASAWFAENGLLEEALQHALAAENTETAGSLVARFGYQLMNDQHWQRLERCIHMLPQNQIERDIALLVLEAWLHHVRQDLSGTVSCIKRIEALNATAQPGAEINVKHVQGHFDAVRGFLHYMAAEGESAIAASQRALRDIPLHHKRARLFADIYQLGAHQMTGKFDTGLSIYQKAMGRYTERDPIYHATYLGNLGLVHWMDANLIALQQTAEALLAIVQEHPHPASVSYGLYLLGITHYQRNELHNVEEKLARIVKSYHAASPMNFAHGAFALALTYQVQGKPGQAREICNSVLGDALETNNADMLQVARAFEAELALRQGRLAEASRWVEKYHAKPFLPVFRFYMPQITAVKILLAQDTTDSRSRAADLLGQLHDFLVSINNNRFRIDALALQALLHDARGEDTAAMEKLSQALDLAEPGGFIRLFLDLGPQMVDLLKQLIKQNVAVDYIGRILDAFKEDEHSAMQGESDHLTARPSPLSTQPLAEPLTNRELDVLELLGQRFQNKEIAEKLFISPETVKKHLNNIYGKLNVSSRRQAVEKAQNLGILSPPLDRQKG